MDLAELGRKTGNEKIIRRHRKTRYKANTRKKFFDDQSEGIFPTDSERVSLKSNPFRVESLDFQLIPGLSLRSNPGLELANAFGVQSVSPLVFPAFHSSARPAEVKIRAGASRSSPVWPLPRSDRGSMSNVSATSSMIERPIVVSPAA